MIAKVLLFALIMFGIYFFLHKKSMLAVGVLYIAMGVYALFLFKAYPIFGIIIIATGIIATAWDFLSK